MAKLQNIEALRAKMRKIAGQYVEASVAVGYTAAYAVYVHENLEMKLKGISRDPRERQTKSGKHLDTPRDRKTEPKGSFWDPQGQGQAKFLEAPARYLKSELAAIVVRWMKRKASMCMALYQAGLRLQAESQTLVPVDTGNLKSRAFTRIESGKLS